MNRLGVITATIQHFDHRIEIAQSSRRTGDNAGQRIESQAGRKRIGENRVMQIRMATRVRSRVRCNRRALRVRRRIAGVNQCRRSRVVHRDRHECAVCSTRITHFDARREITQRRRRTRNRTRDTVQRKTRR